MRKVSLRNLKSVQDKTFGDITVYNVLAQRNIEIFKEVSLYITEMMEKHVDNLKQDENAELDSFEILVHIIPIMTNIDFEDMTEDEIEDALVNPNPDLSNVITEITTTISTIIIPHIEAIGKMVKGNEKMINSAISNGMGMKNKEERISDEEKERLRADFIELTKKQEEIKAKLGE